MRPNHFFRGRMFAVASMTVLLLATGLSLQASASVTPKIVRSGTATFSVTFFSTLDPGSASWVFGVQAGLGYAAFDSLFSPAGDGVAPEIAKSYQYSDHYQELEITLRPHVLFQDGTTLNAQAVAFNFNRYKTSSNGVTEYFQNISSMSEPSPTKIIVHFSVPTANFVGILANSQAGMMVSPTALAKEGSAQFGLMPIGAGPFKVTSDTPGVSVTYSSWPGYWDASKRYLSGVKAIAVSAGDAVAYSDLEAGNLNFFADNSQGTPSVVQSMQTNSALNVVKGPDDTINLMQVNTHSGPFASLQARKALDYCLARPSIVQYVQDGIGKSAYIDEGPGSSYYPGSKLPKGFYNYDPSKGEALVKSLGGLTFTALVNTKVSEDNQMAAMVAQWKACGMNVTESIVSTGVLNQDEADGQYNLALETNGGIIDPYAWLPPFILPSASTNAYGMNDPTITQLLQSTNATTDTAQLSRIWKKLLDDMALQAVNIPISSSPNYYVTTKNLHGESYMAEAIILDHAWIS